MPRKPRIHYPGALYHVIARGNRNEKVFLTEKDYKLYLRFLGEYKDRYGFFLYAYALMPNHLHLLIEVGDTPLARVMQNLQFRYTRNFNIKYKKNGHLFQGRYKAILCEKDSYFLELSAYIHLNPVRASIVKDSLDYPWSSYRAYVKDRGTDLVDRDLLWAQFSERKRVAIKRYEKFIKKRIGQGYREDLYRLKDQRFLGEEEFVEDVRRSLNEEPPYCYDIPISEIVSVVSVNLGIPADLFYTSNRNRPGARGRAIVGYLARKLSNHKIKAVATHFERDPVVVGRGIKRFEQRIREEKATAETISSIENALTRKRKPKIVI